MVPLVAESSPTSFWETGRATQVLSQYNDFGQLTAQYQAHGGAVNVSTTPNVEYAYADGSANTIRLISLTYPNGRVLTYNYGTTDGINDVSSRIEALVDDDSTPLAEYEYLGLGSIAEVDYPQPDLRYRLFDPGLSGDIYTSLDRFGRVIDCHWYDYGSSASAAQIQYGYDQASNRIWREDPVAAANGKRFDELYAYDGLQRLKEMLRGTLNGGKDAITNLQFEQCWSLDATGNWNGFRSDDDGTGWSLVQQRTANEVNEITGISETTGSSWANPAYDPAGNMTTMLQPSDPTGTYAATYDAWNRLVKLTDGEDTVQENQYDARRFRIVRKDYAEGTLDEIRHFYYTPGWQSIEERVDSETDPDRQYVWGLRYIDDFVLRDRPEFEERLYGLQDDNWNMIAIADDNGDVQERYASSAYGVLTFLSAAFATQASSSFAWETLYAGYRYDALIGLFCVRNRYLHPALGLWERRDPLELSEGLNLYEYVSAIPTTNIDAMGLRGGAPIFRPAPYPGTSRGRQREPIIPRRRDFPPNGPWEVPILPPIWADPYRRGDFDPLIPDDLRQTDRSGWHYHDPDDDSWYWVEPNSRGGCDRWSCPAPETPKLPERKPQLIIIVVNSSSPSPMITPSRGELIRRKCMIRGAENDKECPPCPPPPRPQVRFDKSPPSAPHWPCTGDHTHMIWWETNQLPYPDCRCFHNRKEFVQCH